MVPAHGALGGVDVPGLGEGEAKGEDEKRTKGDDGDERFHCCGRR